MIDNTFFSDFTIADKFGLTAIKDTYRRTFREWHTDYKMLTALTIALNHKVWEHFQKSPDGETTLLYNELWEQTDAYAVSHLKDEALRYYYKETD